MKTIFLTPARSRARRNSRRCLGLFILVLLGPGMARAQNVYADPYAFSTLAGDPGYGSADGVGTAARFYYPAGVAVDTAGNVYVADSQNHTIRKMTPAGVVTTLAGLAGAIGSVDGTGSAARFNNPQGVAVDGAGNVYVADSDNNTIRIVTPAGVVTTLAGRAGRRGTTDATGNAARFDFPAGVAVDGASNVYVADFNNDTIRKITPAGAVTTFAGLAGVGDSTDGTGTAARFNGPWGVALDGSGTLYVADQDNCTIREVTASGVVTTLAGTAGVAGGADGTGADAQFNYPYSVAVDSAGNIFVADSINNTIREVSPAGVVATLAGTAGVIGSADGTGSAAQFSYPSGVAVDSAGNVYVADYGNYAIRNVTPAGVVTTLAGVAGIGAVDGTGSAARFNYPGSVALDGAGNIYVADSINNTIRAVTPAGVVTTVSGLAGAPGSADGTGSEARFNSPEGVTTDSTGNLYVADSGNNTIRKITPAGVVTTLAGLAGTAGSADGTGAAARFNYPTGLAVDGAGNAYVADSENHTIRKVTPTGEVTTVAGSAGTPGSTDGNGSGALFYYPWGVAVDGAGTIYVADAFNYTIRKISTSGDVTTLAGRAGIPGGKDGTGSAARFGNLTGIAMDNAGNLFVADNGDNNIRKVTPAGVVTTVAGLYGYAGNTDGLGSLTRFYGPEGVAVDGTGNLYVADTFNNTIRKGIPPVLYTVTPSAGPNGSINPNTPQMLLSGSNVTFHATPEVTYLVDQWLVNGTLVQAGGNSFTVTNVTADESVQVIFRNQADYSSPYTFTTLAGVAALAGPDGTGSGARFNAPLGLAVDTAGNVYVADANNYVIRKMTPAGVVTTLAGRYGVNSGGDGTGTNAYFDQPYDVAVDTAGYVYVADTGNHTIRKITPGGVVTTLAGSAGHPGSDDGTGNAARFSGPRGVAVDGAGNVYVTDSGNATIRKITPDGVVTTLAGAALASGYADGTGSDARFSNLYGLTVDSAGNLFVADLGNDVIRKVTPDGVVTTLAGQWHSVGSTDGTGSDARFSNPCGVTVDSAGNVFVSDQANQTIRQITPDGVVTTLAGAVGTTGSADGTGSDARFHSPYGLSADSAGNVYVADPGNNLIRKVTPTGVVTTLAGAISVGSADGTGSTAHFYSPAGVAVDRTGNVFVADSQNDTIRQITPAGLVTTLAGLAGVQGYADGTGTNAFFDSPDGVAVDGAGVVYVADTLPGTIRQITLDGVVTTIAGLAGTSGSADGTGSDARFFIPRAVAVDSAGNLYIGDTDNNTIRKVSAGGVVTTLAGTAGVIGSADGAGGAAQFNQPYGVAVDNAGNVYVADLGNHTIRKVTAGGVVTTLAGLAGNPGVLDGTGSAARFYTPFGVAVDGAGNVFVADTRNNTIRKVTPAGVVSTLGGLGGSAGSADGAGNVARFDFPIGIAVDSAGNLYVGDTSNNTIRKGIPPLTVTPSAGPNGSIDPAKPQIVPSGASITFSATPVGSYVVDQWLVNGIAVQTGGNSFTLVGITVGETVLVTFKNPVVNHPPVAKDIFAVTPTDQPLSLTLTKVLLSVSDADGDMVTVTGISSTSTNGAAVAMTADAILYTPIVGFNGADRFTYTVTDSVGASTDGHVLVQVRPASVIAGHMLAPIRISRGFTISFMGVPGGIYSLQRATSLSGPWTIIGSVTAEGTGLGSYSETSAPGGTVFYRTSYP